MVNTWPGWESVRLLGEGSFGSVYEIRREEYGFTQRAALKVITVPKTPADVEAAFQDGMDEQSVTDYFYSFVEELVAEFALMYQLKGNNTNIVSYEDHMVVQHDGDIGWDILIRMELLTPLNKYVSAHPLKEEDVIQLGIDMCSALEICRSNEVIHRDIKPENIFYSDTGHFKLGDFGVARIAEKTLSSYSQKGTYSYMAPEVYRREPYGFAVDIYSLGIVLYRFLNNGRTPFLPDYPEKIYYSDREKALELRMEGKTPLAPPQNGSSLLKQVVLKACAFKPDDRYQTPDEFRKALEDALKECNTVSAEETKEPEPEEGTVGVFTAKNTKEKTESESVDSVNAPEHISEPHPIEVQSENKETKAQQITETTQKSEKEHETNKKLKPQYPKMPIQYRLIGLALPILVLIIAHFILVYSFTVEWSVDTYNGSNGVIANMVAEYCLPIGVFKDMELHVLSTYTIYPPLWIGYIENGLWDFCVGEIQVILYEMILLLSGIGMGNLLEMAVSGHSHLIGEAGAPVKKNVRMGAIFLSIFLLALVYLNSITINGMNLIPTLVAALLEFRVYAGTGVLKLLIAACASWQISRLAARIIIRKISDFADEK